MDHKKILSRAWEILRDYRILWVFGIILALTGVGSVNINGSSGVGSGSGQSGSGTFPFRYRKEWNGDFQDVQEAFRRLFEQVAPSEALSWLITAIVVLIVLVLILVVIFTILRYVSETALIRMVDSYEQDGEKIGFRQGFRLGWSRVAWRLFLINLVIYLPAVLVFILLLLFAAAPLLIWLTGNQYLGGIATVFSIGLMVLFIFAFAIVMVAVSLVLQFIRRVCALEGLGVFASIRRGYELVRLNLKDSFLMGLIVVGLRIAYALVAILVLIPVLVLAILVGGAAGVFFAGISSLFASGTTPWIAGVIAGVPLFLLILIIPMTFMQGLYLTYISTTWTLSYRELHTLENLDAPLIPAVEPEPDSVELPPTA